MKIVNYSLAIFRSSRKTVDVPLSTIRVSVVSFCSGAGFLASLVHQKHNRMADPLAALRVGGKVRMCGGGCGACVQAVEQRSAKKLSLSFLFLLLSVLALLGFGKRALPAAFLPCLA